MVEFTTSDGGGNAGNNSPLDLQITDFGPVSSGHLRLKPLTILIGPNGCGKSHVATLIHSIINAESDPRVISPRAKILSDMDFQLKSEAMRVYRARIRGGKDAIDSDLFQSVAKLKLERFKEALVRNFTAKNMVKIGAAHFKLVIAYKALRYQIKYSGTFQKRDMDLVRLKVTFEKKAGQREARHGTDGVVHLAVPPRASASQILDELRSALESYESGKKFIRSIYFPAERAGLLLAYKSLVMSHYANLGDPGAYATDPILANVATEFLLSLATIAKCETDFAGMATKFEARALGGRVVAKKGSGGMLDIHYTSRRRVFPLHVAASSVKDLAVFLHYLKHAAEKGDVVILEEPETNLHPSNQVLFAKLVAKLINGGLNMVITTHSPYFLEQLSHCVVAGTEQANRRVLRPTERLNQNDVAAYRFVPDKAGFKIRAMSVDQDGIPQSEFVDVFDSLYDELTALEGARDDHTS